MATGEQLSVFKGHTSSVFSVSFSSDSKILASGSGDKTIRLWDVATGEPLGEFKGPLDTSSNVSPDGKTLVSGSWDTIVYLRDAVTGEQLRVFKGHTAPVFSVSFSPDGKTLASGSGDGTVCLWDVER